MMNRLVKSLCGLLFLLFFAPIAASAELEKCDDCEAFREGVHRTIIPTDDLACIYYVQPSRGTVVLRITLDSGVVRHYAKEDAPATGRFCPGRSWVRDATTLYLCGAHGNYLYGTASTDVIAAKPKEEKGEVGCLFGADVCAQMGYPVR